MTDKLLEPVPARPPSLLQTISKGHSANAPVKRPRKKRRKMPMFPFEHMSGEVAHDPNNIRALQKAHRGTRISRAMTFWPFWICPVIGFILSLGMGEEAGFATTLMFSVIGFAIAMLFGSIGINLTIAMSLGNYDRRTMKLADGMDAGVVATMLDRLVMAARNGLEPEERPSLQRLLDESDTVLTAMTGSAPHSLLKSDEIHEIPDSMEKRGRLLKTRAPKVIDMLCTKGGAKHFEFTYELRRVIGLIEAIAAGVGLDPAGFGPARDALPQWPSEKTGGDLSDMRAHDTVPTLAKPDAMAEENRSPAQGVRRLGRVWLNGPQMIDDTTAGEANAACGRDLDDLEARWRMARRHAVGADVDQIDRDFLEGCGFLSAKLEEAIALRSAMLRDEMTNGRRYVEKKHARD